MDQANLAFVSRQLNAWLSEQPFWRRYANTVTTAVGGLVALAWWLSTTWTDAPPWLSTVIGILLFVASVVGVKATRNGMTPSTIAATINRLTNPDAAP